MKRTDCHRPGAIVPADYTPALWYALPTTVGGWPVPGINIDLWVELRNSPGYKAAKGADGETLGGLGKCSVCGTNFLTGEVWKHTQTGEHIHVGHICSEKYGLMFDWSEAEIAIGRRAAAAAVEIEKAQKAKAREEFLSKHPGLSEALETDHGIVRDIKERFVRYCSISEKQVALVLKLSAEAKAPPAAQEKHVSAPAGQGRVNFQGTIVGCKTVEGNFGLQTKITVKVETAEGSWLAYGTCPAFILDQGRALPQGIRGQKVEITAGLDAGREPHFAFLKRPVGKLLAAEVPALAA